jgi:hypothetical protein
MQSRRSGAASPGFPGAGEDCVFERRHEKLLPAHHFPRRLLIYSGVSGLLLFVSLAIGMAGYHTLAGLSWVDSFLNASMILTGMGPVDTMNNTPAKLFSGFYALFSGVIFLSAAAVLLSPFLHRFLHKFHLEMEDDDNPE